MSYRVAQSLVRQAASDTFFPIANIIMSFYLITLIPSFLTENINTGVIIDNFLRKILPDISAISKKVVTLAVLKIKNI